jgi:hypothetical protein
VPLVPLVSNATATLDFLEDLLVQQDVAHLLVIGAYRDNEVDPMHPLMRRLSAIRHAGGTVREIHLKPLGSDDLARLITDTLHCDPQRAMSLAQLIREKTAGNPFFAVQFIHVLVDEGLITFDHPDSRWRWDLDAMREKGYTDNVADLMVAKLNRLFWHLLLHARGLPAGREPMGVHRASARTGGGHGHIFRGPGDDRSRWAAARSRAGRLRS